MSSFDIDFTSTKLFIDLPPVNKIIIITL